MGFPVGSGVLDPTNSAEDVQHALPVHPGSSSGSRMLSLQDLKHVVDRQEPRQAHEAQEHVISNKVNEAMHRINELSSSSEKRLKELEAWQAQHESLCDQLRLNIEKKHEENLTCVEDALANYFKSSHNEQKEKALKLLIDAVVESHMMVER